MNDLNFGLKLDWETRFLPVGRRIGIVRVYQGEKIASVAEGYSDPAFLAGIWKFRIIDRMHIGAMIKLTISNQPSVSKNGSDRKTFAPSWMRHDSIRFEAVVR